MHGFPWINERRSLVARIALVFGVFLGTLCPVAVPTGARVTAAAPATNAIVTGVPGMVFSRRLGAPAPAQPRAGQPVRLKIPTINVDAAVEQVGQTPDGSMDIPKNFDETAWYQLGPRPGDTGNAVIDGHVDSTTGKAVFWDLHKLVRGDQLVVVGDDGMERHFAVTDVESYTRADVPLDRVFGTTTGSHLNLITCDSKSAFDPTRREYAGNIVVYADAAT